METLLILSCVLIILAIPFGIKESIAVKKVRIEKTAKLLGYDPVFDKDVSNTDPDTTVTPGKLISYFLHLNILIRTFIKMLYNVCGGVWNDFDTQIFN